MGKIKFSKAFWVANCVELLERMAYYAVFVVITIYLSRVLGFSDVEAGLISGLFSGFLYLLPMFSGAIADKIGCIHFTCFCKTNYDVFYVQIHSFNL